MIYLSSASMFSFRKTHAGDANKVKFARNIGLQHAAILALVLCIAALNCPKAYGAIGQSPQNSNNSIRVQVVDVHGDRVEGAEVTLKPIPDGAPLAMHTDGGGLSVFSNLLSKRYLITVTKTGFAKAEREVNLDKDGSNDLTFSLTPTSIPYSVTVSDDGPRPDFKGLGRMNEVQGMAIYAGKKNEVLVLDNINANLATGITRQVFAKVPGTNVWENEGSGLQVGVSNRGLDPNRSWEMQSRQNGYDIVADIFGYPEAYFTPPLEAVERIEIVRGASSLQYGAQFGGLVNYVLREAPSDRRFTFTTEQTGGANDLFNSHNRMGGTIGKLTYNGYYQHRQGNGWRDNAGFNANTGFGSIKYAVNDRLKIRFENTLMGYRLQMAGGLTDKVFQENPRTSLRQGNWFMLEWLVPSLKVEYTLDKSSRLSLDVFGLRGTRYSLFNSEPVAFPNGELNLDRPDNPRTIFIDRFHNHGLEARYLKKYQFLGGENALAVGFRYSNGKTIRQHGFGFPGAEPRFDLFVPDVFRNLHFRTVNLAAFVENIIRVTRKLSISPGFRFDHIDSTGRGAPIVGERKQTRTVPLFGLGVSYKLSLDTDLYVNISQAYRATLFNDHWRPESFVIVDPNLKDMTGYVCEFGWRGRHSNWLQADVGGFYLKYNDRLGLLRLQDEQGLITSHWTNVSDSRNKGLELFVEADLMRLAKIHDDRGSLSIFSSISKINAHYLKGPVHGNRVESAPGSIIRTGMTYQVFGLSTTLQYSHVGDQFSDASNTLFTVDGTQGYIPSYKLWDLSGGYTFAKRYVLRAGVSNLADAHYFNRRGTSYPGPGLIPADGRSFYAGIGLHY